MPDSLNELKIYREAMTVGESIWSLVAEWDYFAKKMRWVSSLCDLPTPLLPIYPKDTGVFTTRKTSNSAITHADHSPKLKPRLKNPYTEI